eukprot:823193-Prorocentrum_lima.AAC.1
MHVQLLMVERGKNGSGVDVSNVKKGIKLRQQDLGMLRDNLASELAVMEGIPNAKEMETHMAAMEGSIRDICQNLE